MCCRCLAKPPRVALILNVCMTRDCLTTSGLAQRSQLLVRDVDVQGLSVRITGKGRKQRLCPLWPTTVDQLMQLIEGRAVHDHVFLNRCGQPITRFGIHTLVERSASRACTQIPSLERKRVSPHTIRHSTATALLRSGVDINTIRGWLGHVSINTTNIYAEIDLETKARALATCAPADGGQSSTPWRERPGLMEFLRGL